MITFVSDCHFTSKQPVCRQDNVKQASLRKLEYILQFTKEKDGILVSSGDFFHRPRDWFLLPEITYLFRKYDIPFFSVFGQHDTYMYNAESSKRTNLGELEAAGLVTILRDEPIYYDQYCLCGINYGEDEKITKFNSYLEKKKIKKNSEFIPILVAHTSVTEDPLFPGHKITKPKKYLSMAKEFSYIHVGDIHIRFIVKQDNGNTIFNPGPIMRLEASNYLLGYQPGFFYLESEKVYLKKLPKHIAVPSGIILSREHIKESNEHNRMLDEFVNEVQAEVNYSVNVTENIKRYCEANKIEDDVKQILTEVMLDD